MFNINNDKQKNLNKEIIEYICQKFPHMLKLTFRSVPYILKELPERDDKLIQDIIESNGFTMKDSIECNIKLSKSNRFKGKSYREYTATVEIRELTDAIMEYISKEENWEVPDLSSFTKEKIELDTTTFPPENSPEFLTMQKNILQQTGASKLMFVNLDFNKGKDADIPSPTFHVDNLYYAYSNLKNYSERHVSFIFPGSENQKGGSQFVLTPFLKPMDHPLMNNLDQLSDLSKTHDYKIFISTTTCGISGYDDYASNLMSNILESLTEIYLESDKFDSSNIFNIPCGIVHNFNTGLFHRSPKPGSEFSEDCIRFHAILS